MSNHTKGPWEVVRTDAGIIVRTESKKKTRAGASRYAAIGGFDRSDPEQLAEALANANLIAAAPKLLEALEAMVEMYGPRGGEVVFDGPVYDAVAAIVETKGE